jgi:rifampicin phosphotransferase
MSTVHEGDVKLTLPLDAIDRAMLPRAMLPIAGGKAANLGELVRAGLPVPLGFCVTTTTWSSWLRTLV